MDDTTITPASNGLHISVTSADPCKHCGATKRCSRTDDGTLATCYRESKDCLKAKVDRQGCAYWIHRGPNYVESTGEPLPVPTDEIADIETRHRIYSALIAECRLSNEHRNALKARGLSDADINARGYATLAGKPWKIAQKLQKYDDTVQVPGFVVKDGKEPGQKYLSIAAPTGLLVPVRNADGKIIAMKIRPDKDDGKGKYRFLSSARFGGPKAEMTVHVPLRAKSKEPHVGPIDEMRVTEGELKADVATVHDEIPTLSVPGVGNWAGMIDVSRFYAVKTVRLAFDADAETNPDVAHHFIKCHAGLIAAGFHVLIERWPAELGKGIDDLLAAGGKPEVLNGDATEFLEKLKGLAASKPKGEPKPAADKQITVQESDDDPHRLGRMFIQSRFTTPMGIRTLRYWQGEFVAWDRGAWRPAALAEIKSHLNAFIKAEFDRLNIIAQQNDDGEGDGPPKAKKVTRAIVENTILAIQSMVILADRFQQPCWLDDEPVGYPAREMLVTQSGLLHLPSVGTGRECLLPLTPNFFTPTALSYACDPTARCPEWIKFLNTLWPADAESMRMLQEFFGLLLTSDTQFHKLLLIIGPTRSGKGTIGRLAKAMLGEMNVASPTLGSLAEQFGLACLVGKTMALVADARLSGRADAVAVVERLLSITGDDPQDVQRKHLPTLAAIRLMVRFVILANELPRLQDAAGALLSRVLLLKTTESFLGREDRGLEKRLLAELPGILNWAIEGWQRLMARGRFEQPESGRQLIDDLEELASPITQFIRERCFVRAGCCIAVQTLFAEWKDWCEKNNRENVGTLQTFGRDIRAAQPALMVRRFNQGGQRERVYEGIRIRLWSDEDQPETGSGPQWSADDVTARDAKNERDISALGIISRSSEDRGPSRTEDSLPPSHVPPDADANIPRQVRADMPKYPPWVNRQEGAA